jgi:sigma-B regulation protein RsbU (phosphoserine phosphatase)
LKRVEEKVILAILASPDELLKVVNDSIDEFVNDAPQFDDITMLAFRYNGKQ